MEIFCGKMTVFGQDIRHDIEFYVTAILIHYHCRKDVLKCGSVLCRQDDGMTTNARSQKHFLAM